MPELSPICGDWKKTSRVRHRMGAAGVLILQVQEVRRVEAYSPVHSAHEEERWRDADVFDLQQIELRELPDG